MALIEQERALTPEPTTPEPKILSQVVPKPSAKPKLKVTPRPAPKETAINPLDKWSFLASLGAAQSSQNTRPIVKEQQSQESLPKTDSNKVENYPTNLNTDSEVPKIARVTIGGEPARETISTGSDANWSAVGKNLLLSNYRHSAYISKQRERLNNSDSTSSEDNMVNLTPSIKTVPLGSSAMAEIATPIVWSENTTSSDTRATLTLTEPLLTKAGEIALPVGSNLIVEVENIASNGLAAIDVVAVSYTNSRQEFRQQPIPAGSLLVRGAKHQPLIAKSLGDSGGTVLGQDVLLGLLGAGSRGFEVINEPNERTVVSDDGFFRSSTRSDRSLINGALEGAFTTTKERLEARSEGIIEAELSRTKIYQIEAGTPVSIYVNSFLEIDN